MDMDEFVNCILYGDSSGPRETIEERMDWVGEQIRKKVEESMLNEIKAQPLSFRRYSPVNPPSKEWLSNPPPIAVPIHPEMIRPMNSPNFFLDQCRLAFSEKPFVEKMIISINTPKEKTVMQAKTVFDLYFKRAYEALDQAEKDKLDQLIEEDENTKLIDKTFKQLNYSLKDTPKDFVGFHVHRAPGNRLHHCTGDTRKKVEEWSERMTKERRYLDRLHEEVEAQLLSCETYEQAREILRCYDIIDCCGEMQEYKPF